MQIVHTKENKGTIAFCMYQVQQFVGFIYGIMLFLSCQIQDDLSLLHMGLVLSFQIPDDLSLCSNCFLENFAMKIKKNNAQ